MQTIRAKLPWIVGVFLGGCGVAALALHGMKVGAAPAPREGSFAVVELFTSEGCSSCPPADAALADVVTDAAVSGRAIYALSFHVDYWNQLGWADRFSDPAFTGRQETYARALKLDGAYTPQMVVNGTTEFNGSDRAAAKRAIDVALSKAPAISMKLTVTRAARGDGYDAVVTAPGAPAGTVVHVALVERGLSTAVRRGENGGRTLKHENVVRHFQTLTPQGGAASRVHVPLPVGVQADNASVIVYAQAGANGAILGAAGESLKGKGE